MELDCACIHAYAVYMDKLQILFPEPQLRRLRSLARRMDRPVSELVRSSVDLWLSRHESDGETVRDEAPCFHCGKILADGSDLRELANQDRT